MCFYGISLIGGPHQLPAARFASCLYPRYAAPSSKSHPRPHGWSGSPCGGEGLGNGLLGCLLCLELKPGCLVNNQVHPLKTWTPVPSQASSSDQAVKDGPSGLLSALCPQHPSLLFLLRVQTHHTGKGITALSHRYLLSAYCVSRPCSGCPGYSKNKTKAPALREPTFYWGRGGRGDPQSTGI